MEEDIMATSELLQVPGEWHIKYNYTAGEVASKFLLEVRDNKKIMGTRCDKCKKVYVPPRKFCEECFVPATEWVEVDNAGEIESFTFGPRKLYAGLPEPFAIAYVRLNGADTCIANFVKEIDMSDLDKLKEELFIGKKVQVKYEVERKGSITDFYFVPA
jgi:uncharacterized OB-fold protein